MKDSSPRLASWPALALLSAYPLAAQEIPLFTRDFPPLEFAARRNAIYDAIGPDAVALVQGAASPHGHARFRQSNDFYYLCGIEVAHSYLLLDASRRKTILFLPHRNAQREAVEGKALSAEDADQVKELSGIDEVLGADRLSETLARMVLAQPVRILYTPFSPAEGAAGSRDAELRANADAASDPWDGRPSREGRFLALLRERLPQFELRDLTPTIDRLRLIKSPLELTLIRKATRLAGLALVEGMRSSKPGMTEFELDAMAKFLFYRNGAQGESYFSLVASGGNAWFPHYNAGKRKMDSGELLLMDFAPDVGYYQSDVTRMWPVNGRFSDRQRELYGFYLACYEAILRAIRPDVEQRTIMQEAAAEMRKILERTKFSKPEYERAARAFIADYDKAPYRLGHWVGMAVHDVGGLAEKLKSGMVFSIEPQFRVPEERIYIRLEDVIVITENGAEVISGQAPRSIEAIEKAMREPGLLQRYPAQ